MDAATEVVGLSGGAYAGSLNHYLHRGRRVTTLQIDEYVYVVGEEDYSVARHPLGDWLTDESVRSQVIEADDATQALELLNVLREDALLWQCGACDGWIYTSNRPRVGVLACSTCADGGVDFRHADRHVGGAS